MGLFKDDAGKTEDATAGRLAEAANKGNVPISKEFTTAGALLMAIVTLTFLGSWLMDCFLAQMRHGLNVNLSDHLLNETSLVDAINETMSVLLMAFPPFVTFVLIVVLATALAGYGQIGLKYRGEALKLKLERLNPVNNLSKLFSLSSVMRTVVSALKLIVLGMVLYFVLAARMPEFAMMYEHDSFAESLALIAETAFEILFWVSFIVLVIAVGDMAYQRFDYKQNLKMTKQEVEDERKRTDGDPFIKNRLRKAAMEIMKQRMMESVPKADVVITNPTHFSVALRYDRGRNKAPEVVAKGLDDIALTIRELAKENNVPLMEDPPLARALYRAVKVGQEVPERFYQAVAAVLGQVFKMRDEVA